MQFSGLAETLATASYSGIPDLGIHRPQLMEGEETQTDSGAAEGAGSYHGTKQAVPAAGCRPQGLQSEESALAGHFQQQSASTLRQTSSHEQPCDHDLQHHDRQQHQEHQHALSTVSGSLSAAPSHRKSEDVHAAMQLQRQQGPTALTGARLHPALRSNLAQPYLRTKPPLSPHGTSSASPGHDHENTEAGMQSAAHVPAVSAQNTDAAQGCRRPDPRTPTYTSQEKAMIHALLSRQRTPQPAAGVPSRAVLASWASPNPALQASTPAQPPMMPSDTNSGMNQRTSQQQQRPSTGVADAAGIAAPVPSPRHGNEQIQSNQHSPPAGFLATLAGRFQRHTTPPVSPAAPVADKQSTAPAMLPVQLLMRHQHQQRYTSGGAAAGSTMTRPTSPLPATSPLIPAAQGSDAQATANHAASQGPHGQKYRSSRASDRQLTRSVSVPATSRQQVSHAADKAVCIHCEDPGDDVHRLEDAAHYEAAFSEVPQEVTVAEDRPRQSDEQQGK